MPASDPGHGAARLKASPNPQFTQQDPPAPPQSRRDSTPSVSRLARSSRSRSPHNARQPPCRRQIPIDQTGRTTQPNPPAVSSPEACPTPADPSQAPQPPVYGRRPTTLNTKPSSTLEFLLLWAKRTCRNGRQTARLIAKSGQLGSWRGREPVGALGELS
jgi:hypothetical protein